MKKLVSIFMALILSLSSVAFAETMVTTGEVNVRKYPGIDSEVVGWMSAGEEITPLNVIYTYDGRAWVQVDWEGKDGYISDKHLEWCYDEEMTEIYNMPIYLVTTGQVNVRSAADIDSNIVRIFKENTQVAAWTFYVSAKDNRIWAEIELDDGSYGYISMKYLVPVEEMPLISRIMMVNGGRLNVHELPSIDSRDIGTITYGTTVEVEYYIPTNDGRLWASCYDNETGEYLGFVSCKYLEPYTVE